MYTKDDLLDAMVTCKERHGKITTQILNNDSELPSGPTYSNRFDSMAHAAEEAGLKQEAERLREQKRIRNGYTDKEIESFIKENSKDGKITPKEIKDSDGPSTGTIGNYLDTSSIVGEKVNGVKIIPTIERKYVDKEEILEKSREVVEDEGWLRLQTLFSKVSQGNILKFYDSIKGCREDMINKLEEEGMNPDDIQYTSTQKSNLEKVLSDRYVYVLTSPNKDKFYVGRSSNLPRNITTTDKTEEFDTIERIIHVPESKDMQSAAEKMTLKVAREYETTEVYGGH